MVLDDNLSYKGNLYNRDSGPLKKMEEMTEDRMVKEVFVENVAGKRPRGRPRGKDGLMI